MYFIIVSLFCILNQCEVMIEKTNSFIELGNCTDVRYINNLQNSNEISSTLIDTLKKYFYDHFQYGSINITNIYPVKWSHKIREKIKYFGAVSAFRMLSNPNEIISNDISKSGLDEKKDNVIFIAFGRATDSSSSKFEYDIILKLNKNAIQVTSSDTVLRKKKWPLCKKSEPLCKKNDPCAKKMTPCAKKMTPVQKKWA